MSERLKAREDDFNRRHENLKNLSDKELHQRFWSLAEKIVDPMIHLAKNHTSPAIERSIVLRMGFSSLDAKSIVKQIEDRHLLGHGAGHILIKLAEKLDISYTEAGKKIMEGYPIETLNFSVSTLQ